MTPEFVGVNQNFCITTQMIQDIKFPSMVWYRYGTICVNALVAFSVPPPQLNNNGMLIGTVSVRPNPQSTRGIRSRHHHSPLAICMEKAATVSFPLSFFFSPLFPIILTAALSIKLLFCRWHGSPSLSWRGGLDPTAAIACSWVLWRRQWWWVCVSFLFFPSPFQFFFSQ